MRYRPPITSPTATGAVPMFIRPSSIGAPQRAREGEVDLRARLRAPRPRAQSASRPFAEQAMRAAEEGSKVAEPVRERRPGRVWRRDQGGRGCRASVPRPNAVGLRTPLVWWRDKGRL